MPTMDFDQDAMVAAVDLIGRSGASEIEIGYDDDDPANVTWHAQAKYHGARLFFDGKADPIEAVEALARRVLRGARCRRCGAPIMLQTPPGVSGRKGCRWRREGAEWIPGCGKPIDTSIKSPITRRMEGGR